MKDGSKISMYEYLIKLKKWRNQKALPFKAATTTAAITKKKKFKNPYLKHMYFKLKSGF